MRITVGRGKSGWIVDNAIGFSMKDGITTIELNDGTAIITTDTVTVKLNVPEVKKLKEQNNGKEEEYANN